MVISTVVGRFLSGRRLNGSELHELLEGSPELHGRVIESLSERFLTRRALRQLLERVPELRVDLGRRLLAQEPRVLDLLEVLQDVPELRELALEGMRTGEFSPTKVLRIARRNPRLREAAIDVVLSDEQTREQVLEVLRRLPGSESMVIRRLEALGMPERDLDALLAALPELQSPEGDGRGQRSQDWRSVPERDSKPPVPSRSRTAPRASDQRDATSQVSLRRPPPPLNVPRDEVVVVDTSQTAGPPVDDGEAGALVEAESEPTATEAVEPPTGSRGRPDPWRDTTRPAEDDVDRRWRRGRQP